MLAGEDLSSGLRILRDPSEELKRRGDECLEYPNSRCQMGENAIKLSETKVSGLMGISHSSHCSILFLLFVNNA